jgi:hypothetical protein
MYNDRGNTSLEKYRHDQPVVLIKEKGVNTVKPMNIVNGEVTNLEEAAFVFMHFGVYTNGAADTTGMLDHPEEDKRVKSQVLACKESAAGAFKNTN